jgi:hypothetical protein
MNNNLTDFKNDFYNLVKVEDILVKYGISKSTYFVMIKKLGLKRQRSSKMMRTFNMNLSQTDNKKEEVDQRPKASHIPIDDVYKKVDKTDKELVYSKQYVPRGTKLNIEKKNKSVLKEVDNDELNEILDKADNNIARIQKKKQEKQDDTNNKSELLNAINRSTKVREKILNKKNNNKIE